MNNNCQIPALRFFILWLSFSIPAISISQSAVPVLYITIGNRYAGGEIYDKAELLGNNDCLLQVHGCSQNGNYKIEHFKVAITLGQERRVFYNRGSILSDSVKFFIARLKPFDKIEFFDFTLNTYRIIPGTLSFTISDYSSYFYDYKDCFYDFKDRLYDSQGMYSIPATEATVLPVRKDYDNLPVLVFSNCNYESEACSTQVYYRINGIKKLTAEYVYAAQDAVRIKWFFNDHCIADLGYINHTLAGLFSLYYPNGAKRVDGKFENNRTVMDTVLTIKCDTESVEIHHRLISTKEGLWTYYDSLGKKSYTRQYKNDTLVQSK